MSGTRDERHCRPPARARHELDVAGRSQVQEDRRAIGARAAVAEPHARLGEWIRVLDARDLRDDLSVPTHAGVHKMTRVLGSPDVCAGPADGERATGIPKD